MEVSRKALFLIFWKKTLNYFPDSASQRWFYWMRKGQNWLASNMERFEGNSNVTGLGAFLNELALIPKMEVAHLALHRSEKQNFN